MKETKCSFRETAKTERFRCWRFLLPTFVCALLLACSFVGLHIDADAAVGGGIAFAPSCSSCGNTMSTNTTPATCTTSGSVTYSCASCGLSMLGESIPALGHNYTGSGCIQTCTRCSATTGSHSYSGSGCIKTCSGCGATTGSHSYSIVSEAATCTSSGISGKTVCSSCGAVGSSGTVIPPLGHSYSWSGCNGTCTRCGASTISHSYSASGTVAATCTAQGYDLFVCSDCGASYKTNYTAKVSHSYTVAGAYVTAPTCTASGTRTYSCSYGCGNTTTKTVAATGHSPVSADTTATCTSTGTSGREVCSTCGTETAAGTTVAKNPNNHTGSVVKAATASVCKKYDCCGASYDTTHNMANTAATGTCQTCSDCGYKDTSHNMANTSSSGTCQTCSTCGYKDTSHNMANTSTAATCQTCSTCGYKDTSHNMANTGTAATHQTCSTCSYKTTTHSYTVNSGVQYSAATCTAKQKNYLKCSCGYNPKSASYVVETGSVDSSNHTGSAVNGGTSGVHTKYSCCGATISTTHSYTVDSGVQYSAATCIAKQKNYLKCSCGYNPKSSSYVVETGSVNSSNHAGSVVNASTASVCKKYSCCGASYDTTHNMTNTATSATCQTCSDCGYKDTSHNMANTGTAATHQTCSTCGYKTTLHLYSSEVTTAATCTKAGVTTYTCTCGYSYTEAAPAATGHSPNADDGNCETAIMCKTCGEITTAAKTHTYTDASDTTCNNAGCTFERTTGYTVVYNGNGYTGGSTASSTHTIDVAKALTANGFVKQYTVTYVANGGFCSTSSATSAYTFLGWATSAGGPVVYSDKQSVTNIGSAGSTVNLYAVWSTSPSAVTLPTPSRPGYIFKGWFTAASGGGQVGDAGTQYTVTATMTLYAQWTPSNYTLTYNPNGGAINPTTKSYSYGSILSMAAPTRTGYTFKNWYFNATGTNYLNLGRQYMYTDKISIHLDAYMDDWGNFGPGDMRLISCTEGGGWNIETNSASSDGCIVFTMYDAGVGYKTVTTSIKWSSLEPGWHSFDMRFDGTKMFASVDDSVVGTSANFSSGEIGYNETNAIFVGAEAGSDSSVPTSGYFIGKIANVVISDTAVFILGAQNKFATPVSDVTLIADWTANTYTVVYDGNGNSGGSTESSTHTYDVAKNLTPNGFTKTNWVFAGWNTMADGSGTAYADQASVKNLVSAADGTITLYAQWTEEAFDIIYDASSLGLPEGYKILTYIEATGTQYIKTGVKGTARWEFLIQFTDTTTRQLMGYGSSGSQYWGVQTSGKYGVQSSKTLDVVAGEKHFIIHNFGENGKYYLKKGASELTVSANDVSSQEYTLFSIGGNYFCKARLYDLRVFQNGVLIRHFVPCESPDGVVGLYDVVGQAFYTNAGTGEFVPSETYPDEYTPDLAA